MKQFILKIGIYIIITISVFTWICSFADGHTDTFYKRFTTSKKSNLILGTSRAALGLQTNIFDSIANIEFFNYSFTTAHSPFGKTYYESIKKKLDLNKKDGIFIIEINPWSICASIKDPENQSLFQETNYFLAKVPFVNLDPNPFYIINTWSSNYYKIIFNKPKNYLLHDNGWLEVDYRLDSSISDSNAEIKHLEYQVYLKQNEFSLTRYHYLIETIKFLKKHGTVYLVRLPIHSRIMEIENMLMPNFDDKIREAIGLSSGYYNLTSYNSDFLYIDGNHLGKDSAKKVSQLLRAELMGDRY